MRPAVRILTLAGGIVATILLFMAVEQLADQERGDGLAQKTQADEAGWHKLKPDDVHLADVDVKILYRLGDDTRYMLSGTLTNKSNLLVDRVQVDVTASDCLPNVPPDRCTILHHQQVVINTFVPPDEARSINRGIAFRDGPSVTGTLAWRSVITGVHSP